MTTPTNRIHFIWGILDVSGCSQILAACPRANQIGSSLEEDCKAGNVVHGTLVRVL